ncbi:L-threonylcarbamoyladenylate synthase [Sulfurirhabdus autotrophica]|uniref:Threonylcarbamoyl-AMP synthase n=1 Tax=Sulfurirhabdus autotrophica TaxID=1706046 RepID=A0A4V2W0V5_9PROT|nr:L-threonylcarbamoyladenylate synthase [Sulfurirhabdus autotrophica]TCV80269.1 L-threonylcarbamoyladenylate synthase [Sulfurirhabdus autotrophica]
MRAVNSSLFYKTAASPFLSLLPNIRTHLRNGGIIAYATESCYGLGCNPHNYQAVCKILALKGRPKSKGLILIASELAQLNPFIAPLSVADQDQLKQLWPGPTTVLLPAAKNTPHFISGRHKTLAARVTAHSDAARLCHSLGMALVSTSANRSGQRALKSYKACVAAFGDQVMVFPGRIGKRKRPSTIMDLKSGKIFRS